MLAGRMMTVAMMFAVGGYSLYTMHRDGGMSLTRDAPRAPIGEWTSVANGSCEATRMRYRFGEDIRLTQDGRSVPFGRRVTYSEPRKGELGMAFVMVNPDGSAINVSATFRADTSRLEPKVVRADSEEEKEGAFTDHTRKNFTFIRCPARS